MSEASTLSEATLTADAQQEPKTIRMSRASARHNQIIGDCDVAEIIEQIRSGKGVRAQIANIRTKSRSLRELKESGQANEEELKKRKNEIDELKKDLPAFLPSGTFKIRNKNGLLAYSGFICVDVDHLYERVPQVQSKLRESLYFLAVWTSPAGNGVKGLVRVSSDPEKHLASFRAVDQHVFELTGERIDQKCKDVDRLCFLSHDSEIYVKEKAVEIPLLAEPEEPPRAEGPKFSAGDPRLEARRRIVEELLGDTDWKSETRGFCICPGQHRHTTGDGKRDCEVYLDNVPTVHCFHESCLGIVAGVNHELRSRIAKAENGGQGARSLSPVEWFNAKFPSLSEQYGNAVLIKETKYGSLYVADSSEDFLAATLGEKGTKDSPTVFMPIEQKFYTYTPSDGIYNHQRDADLITLFSKLLLECARESGGFVDTRSLAFRLRSSSKLAGVLKKAQGLLAVPDDFFSTGLTEFIPCANGMLRLSDMTLLPFGPSYRRRNKLAVPFEPSAKCPLFLETLMYPALDREELDLVQRWCGLALIGQNLAQRFIILSGTAGGGKGTFIEVLVGIIGQNNVASMRTQLLTERFEIGRLLGKTLLYGADVPETFLNHRGASVLKSLTGGDPIALEFKRSNETPVIEGRFNAIVTCNSRLTVHLEGDADAWRRRLVIVDYHYPKPARVIVDLSRQILNSEGSGVLNWMLEGLQKIRADGWQLHLTAGQRKLVDDLLLESESHLIFGREALFLCGGQELTMEDCYDAYLHFCGARGWMALERNKFSPLIRDFIARNYGITMRHDVRGRDFLQKRGWKGIQVGENEKVEAEDDKE
jgi:P4 family phage/plasmid primase-like protien